jgi:DNA-binding CsgD family transcriptional regulator
MYQEFMEPVGVVDPVTVQVALPSGTAIVAVGHRRTDRAMTPETEEWHLAQLLAPALEAGANVLVRIERQRSSLQHILDQLGLAVFAYDASGREIGRSSAAIQLLSRDTDPAFPVILGRALKDAISLQSNGNGAACRPCGLTRICTMQRQYLVRSSWVDAGVIARDPVALLMVDSLTVELPSKQQLTSRFGLTAREAEISLLLARGASNTAIARMLRISPSTVRTHAERIFPKLGVRSRKALGLLLLQSL